ncbi:multicomponent Na+:H+ antiporter subunit F [Dethiosulfatibacter aminovorans DSM 17477]|uniref:Multicomponent Na+:H+ antiporter subunit F n=1 Tax=Dethiosulfatibacter aminovorans DSM 17477 TaxID=1121476 RepID=A0A1M6GSS7_9FIRM|nr:monovalent cation/H+ antiporter complex subunit F [Dethiosulfatibacter aminovorans]SHJ13003.1 multicomponent Na+:H+ antiporter subunit F [Dethiosulfatibacter aminovorans DSM 17477]
MDFTSLSIIFLTVMSTFRIIIGPTIWDRLLGLNLVTTKLIMLIVLIASLRNETFLLDIALVYSLLGFIGITFMAIYIQNRG